VQSQERIQSFHYYMNPPQIK